MSLLQPDLLAEALQPGDVLVVDTGPSAVEKLIKAGELLHNLPDLDNHVAAFHHFDKHGRAQGIEGRPSGVGWADLTKYLNHPATVSNFRQPKTALQRAVILRANEAMIGAAYDWEAILADANEDIGLGKLWAEDWHGTGYPGHVVCSSLEAWIYGRAELDHPSIGHERFCQPGDWTKFIWDHQDEWLAAA
jgi:hypothetical protein